MSRGPRRKPAPTLKVSGPTYRLSLRGVILFWAFRTLWRTACWLGRRPWALAALAALGGLWWAVARFGWAALLMLCLLAGIGCLAAGMRAEAAGAARGRWRAAAVYRREWQPAMATAGLARTVDGAERIPQLLGVTSQGAVDVVRVRMLPGQVVEDWTKVGPRLAQTFGVLELRARSVPGRVHDVELRAQRHDPLAAVVPPMAPADDVDLAAVPVGTRDDGAPLTLPLLYAHLFVGGETGAGKGSVIWSLVAGAAKAVARGHVRLLGVDPKGGMELGVGRPLFHRLVTTPEEAAALLEATVGSMRSRAARCQQHGIRKIGTVPVPGKPDAPYIGDRDPLVVVVLDELASLTTYVTDAKLRRRIGDALALLLSQGRAVGVVVVAATQDVRKETISLRDLFPVRVALRTAEAEAADMVLGRGARDRGALTDRIRPSTPGVGFVAVDGVPEPVRVRFSYLDDTRLEELAETHRPAARLAAVPESVAS